MSGMKGSGLGLMTEWLAGVMSSSAICGKVRHQNSDFERPQDVDHTFIAPRLACGLRLTDSFERSDALVSRAKTSTLADGFGAISMPGEREGLPDQQARRHGLQVAAQDLDMLEAETAQSLELLG